MLHRICTTLLALGNSNQTDLYADYAQWEAAQAASNAKPKEKKEESPRPAKKKLSYNEKKEYDQIEGKIERLEQEIQKLNHLLSQPEVADHPQKLSEICKELGIAEAQVEQLYLRWDELGRFV
jgi:ATP-binding cassette subfamily F protein uup